MGLFSLVMHPNNYYLGIRAIDPSTTDPTPPSLNSVFIYAKVSPKIYKHCGDAKLSGAFNSDRTTTTSEHTTTIIHSIKYINDTIPLVLNIIIYGKVMDTHILDKLPKSI